MLAFALLFVNWWMLGLLAVVAAGAAIIYFTQGPVVLMTDACDWHTWAIIAAAAIAITMYSSAQTIQSQKATIQTQATENTAGSDSLATVSDANQKKGTRAKQDTQQQAVIDTAKTGEETDDLLDEIAKENADAGRTPSQP